MMEQLELSFPPDEKQIENSSNIGKKFIFLKVGKPNFEVFRFSSEIEMIGHDWDRSLKNNTEVFIISDPVSITRPAYGCIEVVKIMAHDSMWIPTLDLIPIEEKYW